MKIIKKEIRNNNFHNDIKSLKINNTTINNPQEITKTFNDYLLTVVDTVIRNIKKGNSDPRDNVDPSSYLINNFDITVSRINWKYVTSYEIVSLSIPKDEKLIWVWWNSHNNYKIKCPIYHFPHKLYL